MKFNNVKNHVPINAANFWPFGFNSGLHCFSLHLAHFEIQKNALITDSA